MMCNMIIYKYNVLLRRPRGFPGGSDGKDSSAGELGSITGLGRCPEEGNGYALQHSCLENSMDRGEPDRLPSTGLQRVGHD